MEPRRSACYSLRDIDSILSLLGEKLEGTSARITKHENMRHADDTGEIEQLRAEIPCRLSLRHISAVPNYH